VTGFCQQMQIVDLNQNGVITWTVPNTNAVCSIQWAPDLTSEWRRSWANLLEMRTTSATVKASVPMFYRIACWTNGPFVSLPVGRTYQYAVSNSLGETWTSQWTCGGFVMDLSNHYSTLMNVPTKDVYLPHDPHLAHNEFELQWSTDNAFYIADGPGLNNMWWQNATNGTTWSNTIRDTYALCSISTNELVTVPAGVFQCIRIHTRYFGSGLPELVKTWIAPRLMMVKEQRFVSQTNSVPDETYLLQSWSDQ
jgi:hypothetical protein